jgi:hypothetical protein
MIQDKNVLHIKEAKQSERITAVLYSGLLYIIRTF